MKELMDWESKLQGTNPAPTRPQPAANPAATKDRISSCDYSKWDRFDVDQALEEIEFAPAPPKNDAKPSEPKISVEDALFEKEKGNAYFKKAKYKKAIQCYTKSFEHDRTSAIPLVNRSLAFIKLEMYATRSDRARFSEALQDTAQALQLDSKNIKAYWRQGIALRGLGQLAEAKKAFELALVLEPTNSVIRADLSDLEAQSNGKQPLPVSQKPARRRIPVQDINRGYSDVPKAAEQQSALPETAQAAPLEKEQPLDRNSAKPNRTTEHTPPAPPAASVSPGFDSSDLPATLYDFERIWKSIKADETASFALLRIVSNKYLEGKLYEEASRLFEDIALIPRFKMVLMLLSKKDKQDLKRLFGELKTNGVNTTSLEGVYKL
ncbi:hypothetical protein HDU91_007024 [Kappamyces sp. JEL0680]|nr:hypothetical protein HDU91_007024 [Kappamyces sp. JEL0680]